MKEIDNENATKANATRDNMYTNTSNKIQVNQQQQAQKSDRQVCECTNNNTNLLL